MIRGVAQFGLARLPWEQEVGGSNPLAPTIQDFSNVYFGLTIQPKNIWIDNFLFHKE